MTDFSDGIYVSQVHWAQMEADVSAKEPEEACGIVAGEANHTRMIFPVTNILHSASKFRMEPEGQLKAFLAAEENNWDILAVYHSHPNGIDAPSATDFKELTFPGVIYLIWYKWADQWRCRAYLMSEKSQANEVPVFISTG